MDSFDSNKKIDWISKAKGFGILGIVSVHTAQHFSPGKLASIAYSGMYCVQLFFIISAYLTFLSLGNVNEPWTCKSYFKYLAHKIIRLIPVLYITCLWKLIERCIYIGKIPIINDEIWRNVFFAVTFLNGFSYHYINPWLNWYVGVLVIFIALAPFLKKIVDTPKKSIFLGVFSVLISFLSNYILQNNGVDTGWYYYFWFPRQFPVMTIGIVFYFLEKNKGNEKTKFSLYTFLFLIVFGMLLSKCGNNFLEGFIQYGILFLIFTYLLFNKFDVGNVFKRLKTLGDNSYGIYLFHGCLLPYVSGGVSKIGLSSNFINFAICYVCVLFLALGLARIVNILVEKPFFGFVKSKFDL